MPQSPLDGTIALVFLQCRQLARLDMSHCIGVNHTILQAMLTYCRDLEYLDMSGCEFFAGSIEFPHAACASLLQLKLSHTSLGGAGIMKLVTVFPNLTHLEIGHIAHKRFARIIQCCPHVKCFIALGTMEGLDACVPALLSIWTGLEQLEISGNVTAFAPEVVLRLVRECKTLQVLALGLEKQQ